MAGVIIDHDPDTPWIAGALTIDANGIRLELPFVQNPDAAQFSAVRKWFHTQAGPSTLTVAMAGREITLFGCRYGSPTIVVGRAVTSGVVHAESAVISGIARPEANLLVRSLESRIDGLQGWTGLRSTKTSVARGASPENGPRVTIEVEVNPGFQWTAGDATLGVSTSWLLPSTRSTLTLHDDSVLRSSFPEPRSVEAHLAEHRKVQHLIAILYGREAWFRGHEAQDRIFERAALAPSEDPGPRVELFDRRTLREEAATPPEEHAYSFPLADFAQIGVEGLTDWMVNYSERARIIAPIAGVLQRKLNADDTLVNAAVALEAAGRLIGAIAGEEVTMRSGAAPSFTTHVYRSITASGFPWSSFAESQHGLASAISKVYRALKHPEHDAPTPWHAYLAGITALTIGRLFLVSLIVSEGTTVPIKNPAVQGVLDVFEQNGVRVDELGQFVGSS